MLSAQVSFGVFCFLCWLYDHVNSCLNATALFVRTELTAAQQRTAQAHLAPDPAEWTLSNFTRSSVLLHHLFFSFHRCMVNLQQFPVSACVSASSLHYLFCRSSSLWLSLTSHCSSLMLQLLFVLKLLKLHMKDNRQFLAVIHLSFVFQFLGFFSVFLHIQHLFSLAPTGPNWLY